MVLLKSILFLFLVFLTAMAQPHAHAEEVSVCPSLDELDAQILNCGDGYFAAEMARECADKVIASWQLAADQLKSTLEVSGSDQKVSAMEAKNDYDKTMRLLKAQILHMQEGTSLVASYPDVMVDFPDSNGEEESLSCFNEPFEEVQKIVTNLDQEIIKAKKVYAAAKEMKSIAGDRQRKLDASIFKGSISARAIPAKLAISKKDNSDITGIREEKRKQESFGSTASLSQDSQRPAHVNAERILPNSFSSRLDEQAKARGEAVSPSANFLRVANMKKMDSVGAVLWREEPSGESVGTKFELSSHRSLASEKEFHAESIYYGGLENTRADSRSSVANHADEELNIFFMVKSRYRERELFLRSVPIKH